MANSITLSTWHIVGYDVQIHNPLQSMESHYGDSLYKAQVNIVLYVRLHNSQHTLITIDAKCILRECRSFDYICWFWKNMD